MSNETIMDHAIREFEAGKTHGAVIAHLAPIDAYRLQALLRFQSAMTPEMWEAAISGEHERGCPAIADDESDFEHLDDAGECVCALRDGRKALDTLRQELQQTD